MDSGIGGLTVLKQITRLMPDESFIFVGDQKNLPYGEKSTEEVKSFAERIADYLLKRNIKMFVIACNTATAAAYEYLKEKLPVPVIGVIQPGSEEAVSVTKNNRIGIIATNGTIKSHIYEKTVSRIDPGVKTFGLGCPEFVSLVESGQAGTTKSFKEVSDQLKFFAGKDIDTLILGCTHFPVLTKEIIKAVSDDVRLVDPGVSAGMQVQDYLTKHDMLASPSQAKTGNFYTTGNVSKFVEVANEVLGKKIVAEHLDL